MINDIIHLMAFIFLFFCFLLLVLFIIFIFCRYNVINNVLKPWVFLSVFYLLIFYISNNSYYLFMLFVRYNVIYNNRLNKIVNSLFTDTDYSTPSLVDAKTSLIYYVVRLPRVRFLQSLPL
jgi:hypothetical protein